MDISERNHKIALARWKNYRDAQEKNKPTGKEADYWKSAVCGFLAGDGSVQVRGSEGSMRHDVNFYPDNKIMLKIYVQAIGYLYKTKPTIRKLKSYFTARISSKFIAEDLLKSSVFGIKTWVTPSSLLYSKRNKVSWLRAFFSAEGYVGERQIKLQTVNSRGIKQVYNLLKELGIDCSYYEYTPKNKLHSTVSILMILKKEARIKFLREIGFWHSKKESRLKETLGL